MARTFRVNTVIITFALLCRQLPIAHSLPANQTTSPLNGTDISGDTRIVGGQVVTNRTQFAYQVSLRRNNSPFCGASLIDHRNLLSAAHCVVEDNGDIIKASGVTAVLGDLSVISESSSTIRRTVRYIFPHPNYNMDTIQNDVAVLRIDPLDFSQYVNVIPMASVAPSTGSCVVSGWGALWEGGPQSADLRYVIISMITQSTCRALFGSSLRSGMICAGSLTETKDSCQGDSGGPLTCNGTLVGIVSWGPGCAQFLPGVYTDVAYYRDWIHTQMERSSASSVLINFYLLSLYAILLYYNY